MPNFQPIINQIAEALNITTDLAKQMIESYPQLIKEYQMYYMFDIIKSFSGMIAFLAFMVLGCFVIIYATNNSFEHEKDKKRIPFIKTQITILSVSATAHLVSQILMVALAPQIHFIMTHITK